MLFVSIVAFAGAETVKADSFDYDSIPLTNVSYGDYGQWDVTVRSWGMVVKDNNIYLVVNNDPRGAGNNQFQGFGFNFKLGDQSAVLDIDSNEQSKIPTKIGESADIKFLTNNWSSDVHDSLIGKVIVKESEKAGQPTQVLNIKITLSSLVKDPSLVNNVELNNANFGSGKIVSDGASTSPVLSSGIAVVSVLVIGFFVYRRKRQVA